MGTFILLLSPWHFKKHRGAIYRDSISNGDVTFKIVDWNRYQYPFVVFLPMKEKSGLLSTSSFFYASLFNNSFHRDKAYFLSFFICIYLVAYFCPLHVNMQIIYINMWLIYVNMQYDYVIMGLIYIIMKHNYVASWMLMWFWCMMI